MGSGFVPVLRNEAWPGKFWQERLRLVCPKGLKAFILVKSGKIYFEGESGVIIFRPVLGTGQIIIVTLYVVIRPAKTT
jgi:hypothetical protein